MVKLRRCWAARWHKIEVPRIRHKPVIWLYWKVLCDNGDLTGQDLPGWETTLRCPNLHRSRDILQSGHGIVTPPWWIGEDSGLNACVSGEG